MSTQRRRSQRVLSKRTIWKLQDAKAHFSRLIPPTAKPSLYELLSNSPLADLDFEFGSVPSLVRDFEP